MKAFHLTKIENLYGENGIITKGLVPTCGERSKSIGDENCAIYFSSSYFSLPAWWLYLYPNVSLQELCVLTFDVPDNCCIKKQEKEYYTYTSIPPENINIVKFYHGITKEEVSFIYLQQDTLYYGYDWASKSVPLTYTLKETPIIKLGNDRQASKTK